MEILCFICKMCKASLPVKLLGIYETGSYLHEAFLLVGKQICAEGCVIHGVDERSKCYSSF